jgi:hypothetical protein
MRNTVLCHRNLGIWNVVCHMNFERCNTKYCNVSEEFCNTELSHRNLESRNAKCGNVTENFRNTECSLSQECIQVKSEIR